MKIIIEIECPDEGEQPYIVEGVAEVAANCGGTGRWRRVFGGDQSNWHELQP